MKLIMKRISRKIFSRENLYALILCLIVIAILIMTSDQAPQWIYQGF
jgi:lipopolysaccharide/colanic/teichoic acid biosynthesis glycosyltransferase